MAMPVFLRPILLSGLLMAATASTDVTDAFHVTDAEKAACTPDAERLCTSAYPDEQKLLTCMKANRASLGPTCQPVFDAGMKRRGM